MLSDVDEDDVDEYGTGRRRDDGGGAKAWHTPSSRCGRSVNTRTAREPIIRNPMSLVLIVVVVLFIVVGVVVDILDGLVDLPGSIGTNEIR